MPTRSAGEPLIRVSLPFPEPFDGPGVFGFLARRAVTGVEICEAGDPGRLRYARTMLLPHGPAAAEVVARSLSRTLEASLELASAEDLAPAILRLRRLFDLDADPVAVDAALARDTALAPLVARAPGLRVPGAVDAHELVVRAIVGQQISVAAARTHLGRLVAAVGVPYDSSFTGLTHLFPEASDIVRAVEVPAAGAALDPGRPLRLPRRALSTVQGASAALASGALDLRDRVDPADLRRALVALPGIGDWTAGYVTMRVLGHPDTWLPGDVALLSGARAAGIPIRNDVAKTRAHRDLALRAAQWAPWRSYAVMHLWRAAQRAS